MMSPWVRSCCLASLALAVWAVFAVEKHRPRLMQVRRSRPDLIKEDNGYKNPDSPVWLVHAFACYSLVSQSLLDKRTLADY
ncbi:hypothetical protein BO86DRAFT_180850 [Aspergillus japonicus CBS 114.51]|uniref:Uncharacterized protein n=1 Tax=Aspergillus japonicus CBS 114.51 TaxID=1448312 RepID=A0A8T8WRP9_ASPJA|nr:hypothetical protein BO86DRAFT_180850 [Aspergillus japonicus CBS 114.51]RAH78516.1 hypothetical protein BO86DRAFT_180850 [Aspergillus japonicus CBS 114.51]